MGAMTLEAINVERRLFCDQAGDVFPIISWFDGDGDECDPEEAVAAVAGTEGRWYCLDLSEFGL